MNTKFKFDLKMFDSVSRPNDDDWLDDSGSNTAEKINSLTHGLYDPFAILDILGACELSCPAKAYLISLLWKKAIGEIENSSDWEDELPACRKIQMLLDPDYCKLYWTGEDQRSVMLKELFEDGQIEQLSYLFDTFSDSEDLRFPIGIKFNAECILLLSPFFSGTAVNQKLMKHFREYSYAESQNPLIKKILSAFDSVEYPGDLRLTDCSVDDDEAAHYALLVRGADWRTLHPDHPLIMDFLSKPAYHFFLPAFLLEEVERESYSVHKITMSTRVYSESWNLERTKEYFIERHESLSAEQREVVIEYLLAARRYHQKKKYYSRKMEDIDWTLCNYWLIR